MRTTTFSAIEHIPEPVRIFIAKRFAEMIGLTLVILAGACALALASWSAADPSLNHATAGPVRNLLGYSGAIAADFTMQMLGLATIVMLIPLISWGWRLFSDCHLDRVTLRISLWFVSIACAASVASQLPITDRWPLPSGLGGVIGDALLVLPRRLFDANSKIMLVFFLISIVATVLSLTAAAGFVLTKEMDNEVAPKICDQEGSQHTDLSNAENLPKFPPVSIGAISHAYISLKSRLARKVASFRHARVASDISKRTSMRREAAISNYQLEPEMVSLRTNMQSPVTSSSHTELDIQTIPMKQDERYEEVSPTAPRRVASVHPPIKSSKRSQREAQPSMLETATYQLPPLTLLAEPRKLAVGRISEESLEQNARLLEGTLEDFGVKGEVVKVRPGPVVTLYELEPAPGIKSSRVIGLSDDVARSMSALSARIAVVQGRNAIGIELPNQKRETVFLRELLASVDYDKSKCKLPIALGKTIDGEPVIVDLARMPHLLVAGTTGSGKSVAINTMILSLLYRLQPDECRLIMVDPKMLELSVYDGIPHLLTPVVTDPKKAVVALKWAVREMEDRYRKMSKVGVRNIDGFNTRVAEATAKGETISRTVHTGYNRETGEAIYELESIDLKILPYIVVVVDEMADLMMVAGKDIEGAIQRLAQMARAAGIHLIMATQRPSVDVITGTIKANFPTRISFQVTSKIDSRTILGEQGAEQLLGQGDMLYMAGGGRISRVHGPYVSDSEVEKIVSHLKTQGQPEYLEAIIADDEVATDEQSLSNPGNLDAEESSDLYDRAVAIVLRDRKCSTSYIQRRLSVGYNKAASLVERMETEGVIAQANHAGKREILVGGGGDRGAFESSSKE